MTLLIDTRKHSHYRSWWSTTTFYTNLGFRRLRWWGLSNPFFVWTNSRTLRLSQSEHFWVGSCWFDVKSLYVTMIFFNFLYFGILLFDGNTQHKFSKNALKRLFLKVKIHAGGQLPAWKAYCSRHSGTTDSRGRGSYAIHDAPRTRTGHPTRHAEPWAAQAANLLPGRIFCPLLRSSPVHPFSHHPFPASRHRPQGCCFEMIFEFLNFREQITIFRDFSSHCHSITTGSHRCTKQPFSRTRFSKSAFFFVSNFKCTHTHIHMYAFSAWVRLLHSFR